MSQRPEELEDFSFDPDVAPGAITDPHQQQLQTGRARYNELQAGIKQNRFRRGDRLSFAEQIGMVLNPSRIAVKAAEIRQVGILEGQAKVLEEFLDHSSVGFNKEYVAKLLDEYGFVYRDELLTQILPEDPVYQGYNPFLRLKQAIKLQNYLSLEDREFRQGERLGEIAMLAIVLDMLGQTSQKDQIEINAQKEIADDPQQVSGNLLRKKLIFFQQDCRRLDMMLPEQHLP